MPDNQKSHVLIVDDDAGVRSFLFAALDRCGYRVTAAADGVEGLSMAQTDSPDVMLVDLRMPRMSGEEFAARVLDRDPEAVIIILTGHGTIENAVELMRRGVFSVVPKPIGIDEIQFTVEKALRERRLKVRSRELERRLEISERLAMIGKLAAGVAHELNNPLDGVIRFVRLTLDTLTPGTEAREFQEDALRGLRRMSSIVKDLLTFSRNIALEVEEERLELQVKEAVSQVLGGPAGQAVEVVYDLAVPDVRVPRGLFQVFQNLVKNALDSLDEDGRIEIRAGIRDGEIFIAIADTGCGIPDELMDRVYEPFFTTKEVGQGTGLGLSIVNRIMERFGGGVDIESEVGRGTTVTVFLPVRPAIITRKEESEAIDAEGLHTSR